jgi:hypothetical protein
MWIKRVSEWFGSNPFRERQQALGGEADDPSDLGGINEYKRGKQSGDQFLGE